MFFSTVKKHLKKSTENHLPGPPEDMTARPVGSSKFRPESNFCPKDPNGKFRGKFEIYGKSMGKPWENSRKTLVEHGFYVPF